MIIMQPIFYALTWHLFKLFKFEPVSATRLGVSRDYAADECSFGHTYLRLAGEAYELPTIHAPTMR